MLRCKKDETFDEFNAKLNAIVNDPFTLADPIPEHRIVKKILRSFQERFDAKVVAINPFPPFVQSTQSSKNPQIFLALCKALKSKKKKKRLHEERERTYM